MKLKNYMEDVVREQLDKALIKKRSCDCDRCRADIVAYVLNQLPPKYVVTRWGHIYTKLNQLEVQSKADIIVLIEKAMQIVSNQPRHEKRKS